MGRASASGFVGESDRNGGLRRRSQRGRQQFVGWGAAAAVHGSGFAAAVDYISDGRGDGVGGSGHRCSIAGYISDAG